MDMADAQIWFAAPRPLLPAPSSLVRSSNHKPARAHKPAALLTSGAKACAQAAGAKKPRALATPSDEPTFLELRDRALEVPGVIHLSRGRYLHEGAVVVVPQRLEDFQSDCCDAMQELLLIELSAPGGSWLEDTQVRYVHVALRSGDRLLPVDVLRRYVRACPNVFRRPLPGLKKLDMPFRCPRYPEHLLLPVATSAFADALASAATPAPSVAASSTRDSSLQDSSP